LDDDGDGTGRRGRKGGKTIFFLAAAQTNTSERKERKEREREREKEFFLSEA